MELAWVFKHVLALGPVYVHTHLFLQNVSRFVKVNFVHFNIKFYL